MVEKSGTYELRYAESGDMPEILEILNHYILTDPCIFDIEPWNVAQKQDWFDSFTGDGPYRQVGFKFGKHWDVTWFQKAL